MRGGKSFFILSKKKDNAIPLPSQQLMKPTLYRPPPPCVCAFTYRCESDKITLLNLYHIPSLQTQTHTPWCVSNRDPDLLTLAPWRVCASSERLGPAWPFSHQLSINQS